MKLLIVVALILSILGFSLAFSVGLNGTLYCDGGNLHGHTKVKVELYNSAKMDLVKSVEAQPDGSFNLVADQSDDAFEPLYIFKHKCGRLCRHIYFNNTYILSPVRIELFNAGIKQDYKHGECPHEEYEA
ncbi:unnamed protein product [Bursaphelenchus okinawaensis]|uniref:Transthyretin-like family protein n=1 Tax=Bursaphelenchus okinawaensis TaxID=465554 RepID=A0A811LR67_9BILA|nr:unnamed protein product [Bursaphelenchus okinawaensis]CAG9127811.1 unnamed protein product [Bursaphelenchus okinawaensis]